jgi:hypothetical protein
MRREGRKRGREGEDWSRKPRSHKGRFLSGRGVFERIGGGCVLRLMEWSREGSGWLEKGMGGKKHNSHAPRENREPKGLPVKRIREDV